MPVDFTVKPSRQAQVPSALHLPASDDIVASSLHVSSRPCTQIGAPRAGRARVSPELLLEHPVRLAEPRLDRSRPNSHGAADRTASRAQYIEPPPTPLPPPDPEVSEVGQTASGEM